MKKEKKEAEYKQKAGTAWSHSYLNQKPWHPLSYPNQRRKWIAEQTHAQQEERKAEVSREFAQEQDFFRQTAQMSKKEKEKMEARQAVSFMYMRPPGYNAEAARAAEIADERKKLGLATTTTASTADADSGAVANDGKSSAIDQVKLKPRVKDVFGKTLPTEEEFPALKDAPRHDTGAPTRVKPFAIEIRNVKCARCGAFGHQSGDRECPLKDVLMPNEEARLIREDPLNVILAQTESNEVLKWELKQRPGGLSPARGGFKPDHPNQQIIPDENIYDEYGGFLPGGGEEGLMSIPNLLASLSQEQRKQLTDANCEKKNRRWKDKKGKKVKKKYSKRKKSDSSGDEDPGRYRDGEDGNLDSGDDYRRSLRHRGKRKSEIRYDDHRKYGFGDDGKSDSFGDEHRGPGRPYKRKDLRSDGKKRRYEYRGKGKSSSSEDDRSEDISTSKGRFDHTVDNHRRSTQEDRSSDRYDDQDNTSRQRSGDILTSKGRFDRTVDDRRRSTQEDRSSDRYDDQDNTSRQRSGDILTSKGRFDRTVDDRRRSTQEDRSSDSYDDQDRTYRQRDSLISSKGGKKSFTRHDDKVKKRYVRE